MGGLHHGRSTTLAGLALACQYLLDGESFRTLLSIRRGAASTISTVGHGTVGDMNADNGDALARARVATRLPAQDLDRARRFYAEQLGMEPVDERPGGLLYRCGGTEFAVYRSTGTSPGTFTQMGWQVEDVEAVVTELRRRGVRF